MTKFNDAQLHELYRENMYKQEKLTSVDYLLLLLVNFDMCTEEQALKMFRNYKRKIFGY